MRLFYTDTFVLPLPSGHRFPMERYRQLRDRLRRDRRFDQDEFLIPAAATDAQLLQVHTQDWVSRVVSGDLSRDEIRRIGFPWSPEMVARSRRSTGATIEAAQAALNSKCAINLAGGTHHAYADRGAGYCVFNDVAVATRDVQRQGGIRRVLIADGDVHQGDGTASIFASDPNVRTFSLHAERAFPLRKQRSDVDISLPPETGDRDYLAAWERGLDAVTDGFHPELVFYLAGADPFEKDLLGGLAVSRLALAERDRALFLRCARHGWPVVIVMAGGYAPEIDDIVDIQFQTIVLAREILSQ